MTRELALGMRSLNRDTAKKKMESYFGPDTPYAAIRELRIRLMDEYIAENGVEAKPGIYALWRTPPPGSSLPIGRGACPSWFPTRTSRTKRPGKFSLPKPIPWLTLSASYNFCRTISSITVDNYESKCYCIFVDNPSLQKESVKENE